MGAGPYEAGTPYGAKALAPEHVDAEVFEKKGCFEFPIRESLLSRVANRQCRNGKISLRSGLQIS
jgi:hypothetical protein